MCEQILFVCLPIAIAEVQRRHIPASLAKGNFDQAQCPLLVALKVDKAKFGILLPIPIRGQLSQAPEARFAFKGGLMCQLELVRKQAAFCDVQMGSCKARRCAVSVALSNLAATLNPYPMALFVAHAEFDVKLSIA